MFFFFFFFFLLLLLFFVPPVVKIPGVKNKLEWLRVGVVLSRERFVKEDRIEPLNQDTDPLK